jgi:hypothetical protein
LNRGRPDAARVSARHWIKDGLSDTWTWLNAQGQAVYRYTAEQLRAMWKAVQQATDLSWEMLKRIEWGQVMAVVKGIALGLAAVVLVVAGAYVICVITAAVFTALTTLLAIIGTAGAVALASLGLALGVAAAAR